MISRAVCPVLAGEAGMGKTRLATELTRRARTIQARVLEGACSEAELSLPYLPFLGAVGKHLGSAAVEPLGERLGPHRRLLAQLFPQLGTGTTGMPAADGTQAKLSLFEAIVALLELVAEESGLLLVIEDLQWADASTHELLDYLTRRIKANPILVLATYRRGEMHRRHPLHPTIQGWRRSGLATMVELEPMSPDGIGRMLSAIFDEPTRDDTRDFFHARCEGNPFVLEELLKVALDRGDVYRTGTGWERRALADFRLPATVRDSVLLRVDRLPPDQAEVLRIAAVLGRSFDDDLLRDVCGREIEDELEAFADQQLIEDETGQMGRYRFRHSLTHQAIYDSLSRRKRERLHGQAAASLRKRPAVSAVDLGQHLIRARLDDEALPLLLEAANDAERARAYREAAELRERALASTDDPLARARLTGRVGETLELAGDSARGLGLLEEAIAALHRLGQAAEAEHYRVLLGRSRWNNDRHDLARADFEQAIDGLEQFGPSRDLALALAWRGGLEVVSHRVEAGEPFVRRAIEVAEAAGAEDVRIWARNYLGEVFAEQFLVAEAFDIYERCYQEALAADLPAIALNVLNNLDADLFYQASPRAASMVLGRLRALRMEIAETVVLLTSGWIAELQGDLASALDFNRRYVEMAERIGNPRHVQISRNGLARTLVLLGRLEEARPLITRPDPGKNLQLAIERCLPWCEYHLAKSDPAQAAEGARPVLAEPHVLVRAVAFVPAVMHALVANGELALAETIAGAIRAHPRHGIQPHLLVALARFELASAHPQAALELSRRVAPMFADRGDVLDELTARILSAQCLVALDADTARLECLACIVAARRMQARYLENQALDIARGLGVRPPPEAVEVPNEVGEKLVTVLFADVRGYTAMTTVRPPAEMVDVISAFQRWAKEEVENHHGLVDKFAGDAVMATFNISGATVDHTRHALGAARALSAKAALLELPLGIAIAVGPAIVGRLAPGANVSVLGEATNLAARLVGAAGPGEIVLSAAAYKRVSGLNATPEALSAKGFDEPVTAYRLQPERQRSSS